MFLPIVFNNFSIALVGGIIVLVNKESILQLLENEIDKLSADYNDQINDLNKQILKLKDENNKLKRK